MAVAVLDFSDWLGNKLKGLNTDEGVFGSYIISILDSDETTEEKNEGLESILSEIVENPECISELCMEIFETWKKFKEKEPSPNANTSIDLTLSKLLESQCLPTTAQRQYTDEEKKIRNAILSQYSQMTDDEEDEAESGTVQESKSSLEKNVNASKVAQAEKERRDYAKEASQKKKDKDKEDREKQKQLREEKKEKRKTVKGERRR